MFVLTYKTKTDDGITRTVIGDSTFINLILTFKDLNIPFRFERPLFINYKELNALVTHKVSATHFISWLSTVQKEKVALSAETPRQIMSHLHRQKANVQKISSFRNYKAPIIMALKIKKKKVAAKLFHFKKSFYHAS